MTDFGRIRVRFLGGTISWSGFISKKYKIGVVIILVDET
jgi:hypothetical protein